MAKIGVFGIKKEGLSVLLRGFVLFGDKSGVFWGVGAMHKLQAAAKKRLSKKQDGILWENKKIGGQKKPYTNMCRAKKRRGW